MHAAPHYSTRDWQRREQWLTAATTVTHALLADDGRDPLAVIARAVRTLADAAFVTVALPTQDGRRVMVEVADGAADECVGLTYTSEGSLAGQAIASGRPVIHNPADAAPSEWEQAGPLMNQAGAVVAVPLIGTDGVRGALVICRSVHGKAFTADELELATAFAGQAAVSLELADGRENRRRIEILEDRTRLAGDLHDHVIQRLFAAALTLEVANGEFDSAEVDQVVVNLRDTIGELRQTIAGLRGHRSVGPGTTLTSRINRVVDEASVLLPRRPLVRIDGPLDALSGDATFADDIVAVVRETLSNVGKHARATRVDVELRVTDGVVSVEVTDDGVGPGDPRGHSGLDSLRRRAHRNRGAFAIVPVLAAGARPGTRVSWTGRHR